MMISLLKACAVHIDTDINDDIMLKACAVHIDTDIK